MNTEFKIKEIAIDKVAHLFELNSKELEKREIHTIIADSNPGFPCRVSLKEANIGEKIFAFNYQHHDVRSPYRASGPIFVRENAIPANLNTNEIPEILEHRLLSVRAYDRKAMMIDAKTVKGEHLRPTIHELFSNGEIAYLQVHNSSHGCYNCQIDRVTPTEMNDF